MTTWPLVYQKVLRVIGQHPYGAFFRGQRNGSWPLFPGLARVKHRYEHSEQHTYFDFRARAGTLLPRDVNSWDQALIMQHHGLPTRLLDWSEVLGVALHFAAQDETCDGVIWALDPYRLNEITIGRHSILDPDELPDSYERLYINNDVQFDASVIALAPIRHNPRVFQQRACFTVHQRLDLPLEKLYPAVLTRIEIPAAAKVGAREFLRVAGVSEFSLFPDLDGLARELREEHFVEPSS